MSNLSLTASVRTCSVNVGNAPRIESDRTLNPNQAVCIPWNGVDLLGRPVHPDTFNTQTAGCRPASDRINVENDQRPKYFNYITLGAEGLQGNMYGSRNSVADPLHQLTGNYGTDMNAVVHSSANCTVGAYERAMAEVEQSKRENLAVQNAMKVGRQTPLFGGYRL